jgi:hypothetical protein
MAGGPTGWGQRRCNNGQPKGVFLVDMAVGQVVYREEVTQKGSQGWVVGGVLAMVRRMRRRDLSEIALWRVAGQQWPLALSPVDKLPRYSP